ncbi:MAG: hypothetical protein WBN88_05775 [Anderseniella sp.]
MRKSLLTATAAIFAFATPANAADVDRELGLIVSGVVDSWAGVQFIDDGSDDDTVFVNGGEGLLSLPLGDNLSIQSDVKYEYNTYATEDVVDNDVFGPRYSFQGAVHLSWRDPARGLFGVFGGAGTTAFGFYPSNVSHDVAFVGGEAQIYLDNVTLYGQGGYVDFDPSGAGFRVDREGMTDGFFTRGVVRWFLGNDSRIQLEGTYLKSGMQEASAPDVEVFSVGAQYDFVLAGLPIVGDTPLFVGYRGTFREDCNFNSDVDDHTVMIGTTYSFSGDRLTVDRQGATLDTPDFNHSCIND